MIDPLAQVVELLKPCAPSSKAVSGAGRWHVRRAEYGRPFYLLVMEGSCRLAIGAHNVMILAADDFVLIPSAQAFAISSLDPTDAESVPVWRDGEYRVGTLDGPAEYRSLIGYCEFGSEDAALLVSLLPRLVHIRGEKRLATIVKLVKEETANRLPARDVVLARLLEVLLIEALRATQTTASQGLVRALADDRLATALRRIHEDPKRPWTIAQLAKEASLSRSAFFARFSNAVGVPPMEYLFAWRMALAKLYLQQSDSDVAGVAERVGYSSASTFSVAFSRHVGLPSGRFARKRVAVS